MEFPEKYIKMCEMAIYVQNQRGENRWKEGDFYVDDILRVRNLFGVHTEGVDEPYDMYNPIWLPLFHQLIEIAEYSHDIWFWTLVCEPEGYLCFGRDNGEDKIYPRVEKIIYEEDYCDIAEEAMLKMVMWDKCDLIWDDRKNEWIPNEK